MHGVNTNNPDTFAYKHIQTRTNGKGRVATIYGLLTMITRVSTPRALITTQWLGKCATYETHASAKNIELKLLGHRVRRTALCFFVFKSSVIGRRTQRRRGIRKRTNMCLF
jgi:hypothetical protein